MKKLNQNNAIATTAMKIKTNAMKNRLSSTVVTAIIVALFTMLPVSWNEVSGQTPTVSAGQNKEWGKVDNVWYIYYGVLSTTNTTTPYRTTVTTSGNNSKLYFPTGITSFDGIYNYYAAKATYSQN